MFAWILDGEQRVGAFDIDLFNVDLCTSNDQFYYLLDEEGVDYEDLAVAICETWEMITFPFPPIPAPIVHIRFAWIDRRYGAKSLLGQAVRAIRSVLPECAVLVFKAYPFGLHEIETDERSLLRKQKAMQRHYNRVLGAQPFPRQAGRRGWMIIDEPIDAIRSKWSLKRLRATNSGYR